MEDSSAAVGGEVEDDAAVGITIRGFRNTIPVLAEGSCDDDVIDFLIEVFGDDRLRNDTTTSVEACDRRR